MTTKLPTDLAKKVADKAVRLLDSQIVKVQVQASEILIDHLTTVDVNDTFI
jgi:hypothetical protein